MKAWQVLEWCEPEGMVFADVAMPEPGPGEVRIRNHAAALNFFDILLIAGKYQVRPPFPFAPGAEVAGLVDAIGDGVSGFAIGDRVQAILANGGYAEYSIAPAAKCFHIPAQMGFTAAAAMPIVYQTTWFALTRRCHLQPGEWLLVLAAAGGVGSSAIQLGKALGARVIAAAAGAEKLEYCRRLGADHVVDYSLEKWPDEVKHLTGGRGVDVIYDPVGGDWFDQASRVLAIEGRLLVIGFAAGRIPEIAVNRLLLRNISVVGVYWGGYVEQDPDWLARAQRQLFDLYDLGEINPIVTETAPLAEAPAMMRALAGRKLLGKAVLVID